MTSYIGTTFHTLTPTDDGPDGAGGEFATCAVPLPSTSAGDQLMVVLRGEQRIDLYPSDPVFSNLGGGVLFTVTRFCDGSESGGTLHIVDHLQPSPNFDNFDKLAAVVHYASDTSDQGALYFEGPVAPRLGPSNVENQGAFPQLDVSGRFTQSSWMFAAQQERPFLHGGNDPTFVSHAWTNATDRATSTLTAVGVVDPNFRHLQVISIADVLDDTSPATETTSPDPAVSFDAIWTVFAPEEFIGDVVEFSGTQVTGGGGGGGGGGPARRFDGYWGVLAE